MGGLSRKATQLETLREDNPLSLTLDAGGLLFSRPILLPSQLETGKITAKAINKAYGMMHYDAVGISAYDLAAGIEFLQEISRKAEFPWLSANILHSSNQKPVFQPATTKTIGTIKVGIIGITNPAAHNKKDENFTIVPWQQTLPSLAREMSASCDMLILLSSMPDQINQQIAKEVGEIHLILQGATRNQPTQKIQNTLITGTGKKGKYIGELSINWQPTKKWCLGNKDRLKTYRQRLDQINWRLKKLKKKGFPEKGADNPRVLKNYQNLVAAKQQLNTNIALLENSKEGEVCTYINRFIALEKKLPEQPEVQKVVDRAKAAVHLMAKKRTTAVAQRPSLYLGWRRCAECHPDQKNAWLKSRHADSYQTLVNKKQQFNLDCLPCHVTGITATNEQQALSLAKEYQQVGCEACHGAGTEHAKTQGKRPIPTPRPTATVCLHCHTPEHSDDFNFERDRHLVH